MRYGATICLLFVVQTVFCVICLSTRGSFQLVMLACQLVCDAGVLVACVLYVRAARRGLA